ncbi:MAG: hypothetical protein NVV62_09510 [Terricaulis sp.]|nr:hypothetical protein [Terricaulis sp.]
MLRLAFLLIIAVAAVLVSWQVVATDAGSVEINWFGTQVTTSALFGLLLLVAIIAVALPLLRLAMFLMDAPGRIGKASQRQRVRKGQEALALGLIAAEAGEFEAARRHADKAEDLIDEPRLALLLQARAAEVSGDTAGAERAYAGMLQNEDTEVLGRKGLMAAALKRGDRNAARARMRMRRSKPRKPRPGRFNMRSIWRCRPPIGKSAIETLDLGDKRKLIEDKVAKRRRAVLMTAQSQKLERERRPDKAAEMAQKAFRMAPSFAPAGAMAARLLVGEGKAERAASILEEAWENGPHPALAHAYRDLIPGETREGALSACRRWPPSAAITAKAASCWPNSPWSGLIGPTRRPILRMRTGKTPPRASAFCLRRWRAAKAMRTRRAPGWRKRPPPRVSPIGQTSIPKARPFSMTTAIGRAWFTCSAMAANWCIRAWSAGTLMRLALCSPCRRRC